MENSGGTSTETPEVGRGGGRGGRRYDRDLTQGSIFHNLWTLAWPMAISTSLREIGPTIDLIWIGKLGPAPLAGVGVSAMLSMLVNAMGSGIQVGTRAMIARRIGAGDMEGANHAMQQAFTINVIFSAMIAAVGVFMAKQILTLFGLAPDVIAQGVPYMRINFVGQIFGQFWMLVQAIMEASGDSVTPMRVRLVVMVMRLFMAPAMIFGLWFFPKLGVTGAALNNVINSVLAVMIAVWIIFTGHTRLRPSFKGFRFDGNMIWRILRIGIPNGVAGVANNIANLTTMSFVVPFGTAAVAAHALMNRLDLFMQMPGMGLGQGAGVLAGQNIGAGKPERAEKTAWMSVGIFTGFMFMVSIVVWFFPANIIRLFNTDPELVRVGSIFIRISIAAYMVQGSASTLAQCLNGVGDTMMTMWVTLTSVWAIQMPAAYLLSHFTSLGVYGVRSGMMTGIVIRALVFVGYFRTGRWKNKKV